MLLKGILNKGVYMNYKKKMISWDDVYLCINNIITELQKDKVGIDVLVPVLKGGFIASMFLGKNLDIDKFAGIQVRRSDSNIINSDFHKAKYLGITNPDIIKNAQILIVEDIIHTGKTIELVVEKLKKYQPSKIYICALYNYYSGNDFGKIYQGNVNKNHVNWIVFPWDYQHPEGRLIK